MRTNDAVSGAILIILAVVMIAYTTTFPPFPGQDYGPSLFPRLLGAGLVICGGLLVRRGLATRVPGQPLITLAPWMGESWRLGSFLLTIGCILFYIFAAEPIGFLIVAFLILIVLFLWFGVRPVVAVSTAIIASWTIHWFFVSLMRVPLPRGLLNNIL